MKFLKKWPYLLLTLLILILIWVSYFILYGNFHKIDDNGYRSAQLFSHNMPYYLKNHKIKSIINLRGPSTNEWYLDELKVSAEHNVSHYDYDIGDRRIVTAKELDDIVALIRNAPKPLLIHCKAGADRASLGTALYEYAMNRDYEQALKSFSLWYGHFPWLGSQTIKMNESFDNYVKSHPLTETKNKEQDHENPKD